MPVVSEYEYHEITSKFRYATFFPFTRSVDITEETPEGISASILAKTSQNSWSERQLTEQQVTFDEEKDKAGPIPLAVVATIEYEDDKGEEAPAESEEIEPKSDAESGEKERQEEKTEGADVIGEEKPKQEGRLAVFGDSAGSVFSEDRRLVDAATDDATTGDRRAGDGRRSTPAGTGAAVPQRSRQPVRQRRLSGGSRQV